jgi:formylglycine-generating enzyme required for sulfatase activity
MRAVLLRLSCLVSLLIASSASAVTMDWVTIGGPNLCDVQLQGCFGAVANDYRISKYEVTYAQYTEFLNGVADADPYGLYNPNLASVLVGGITRSGASGSYMYSVIPGHEDRPVNYVSFFDALRFVNWLSNGQGAGDTESGAYTLLGGSAIPSNGNVVTRELGAAIFLPSEDEWYKAAYYDPSTLGYFDFPAGSNAPTTCAAPSAVANQANCNSAVGDLTSRGSYTGSASPYGTFDQGGNVYEWDEAIIGVGARGLRGGSYRSEAGSLAASVRDSLAASLEDDRTGFRVAAIVPEPGTGLLLFAGLVGFAGWRKVHA